MKYKFKFNVPLIISILVNVFFIIVLIFRQYERDFDFTLNNWEKLSPFLSFVALVVSLYFLIKTQKISEKSTLISERTLNEMKIQRLESYKPHLIIEFKEIDCYFIDYKNIDFDNNENMIVLFNSGFNTATNIEVNILYTESSEYIDFFERVKKGFDDYKGKIGHLEYFIERYKLLLSEDSFRTAYIEAKSKIEMKLPFTLKSFLEIYLISKLILEGDKDEYQCNDFTGFAVQIIYKDLNGYKIEQSYKMNLNIVYFERLDKFLYFDFEYQNIQYKKSKLIDNIIAKNGFFKLSDIVGYSIKIDFE